MPNIPSIVRQYVTEELRGVYTISMAIVEDVDQQNRQVSVSRMSDKDVVLGDVPIASPYAEEGYGEVYPIQEGTEGLLFHTKAPLTELIVDPGHQELDPPPTEFRLRDGIFFPQYWNDNETTPAQDFPYKEGDYLFAHESGTTFWIYGPNSSEEKEGTVKITTGKGEQGFKLDTETGAVAALSEGGYGLKTDGQGKVELYHKELNFNPSSTTL